jgi:arylsulfatase A-like enzyme
MGCQTPNIDRIAKEGALFTDWYAQQSCTAGREAAARQGGELHRRRRDGEDHDGERAPELRRPVVAP